MVKKKGKEYCATPKTCKENEAGKQRGDRTVTKRGSGRSGVPVDVAEQLRLVLLYVRELVPEHGFAVDPRHHHPLRANVQKRNQARSEQAKSEASKASKATRGHSQTLIH